MSLLLAAALAGCAGDAEPQNCPTLARLPDADRLTRFDGAGRDLTDVLFEAEVGTVGGSCAFEEDAIDVEMEVEFIAQRGPADTAGRGDFSYFVAIVDSGGQVLARQAFPSDIAFTGSSTRAGVREELDQHIPLSSGSPPYTIYVGFELSPEELAFNRAGR